ncbi:MAG: N-acetylmuramoyl-L-alanine amidase, partial [Bacteroidota bacterium]
MLQAIIDFFKKLFGSLKPSPSPPPVPPTTVELPKIDEAEAQDGSEVTPDTTVMVIDEESPFIIDDTPDPMDKDEDKVEVPPDPPVTEDPVITTPTDEDPPVVTDPATPDDENEDPPEEEEEEVAPESPKPKGRFLWCLDNGHGKQTAGKRSPKLADGTRFFEYEFNRDIVKRIIKALDKHEVSYYNVVPEVDTDNFLQGRVARANSKESTLPKIFLSIHSNAGPAPTLNHWSTASGIETWYFHNSSKGRKLASVFQKELIARLNWKNRNIRSQPRKQFYVLRNTKMPAVLTENGFYNNRKEVALLNKSDVRQKIADAHVAAILHF